METLIIIIAILFCVFLAIRPVRWLNMATGPLLILALLFIFQVIDLGTIWQGIIDNGQMQPWKILVIFFSVAYVSISTDMTGIFDYIAYRVIRAANGSGFRLFVFFYIFACLLTTVTSNDIVILTLTPIIFYLGRHAKLNVVPLLFAEFFGANAASMLLFISSPTNIIIGTSLGIGFSEYLSNMWLPTLVAIVINLVLLVVVFRKKITQKYTVKKSSNYHVRNWFDALMSSGMLLLMLVLLILSDKFDLSIWIITLTFAAIFIVQDLVFGLYYHIKESRLSPAQLKKGKDVYGIPENKNEFWMAWQRVPWKILPFIAVIFVLVQGLNDYGFIDILATVLSNVSTTVFSGIFIMGSAAFVLANMIIDQPMTILMSNVLTSDNFLVSESVRNASAYAILIASNLATNLTIIGALAGLMWKQILRTKGIKISYRDFLIKGLQITPIVFVVTCLTLWFSFLI